MIDQKEFTNFLKNFASLRLRPKAFSAKCNICWAYTALHFLRKPPSMFRARLLGVRELFSSNLYKKGAARGQPLNLLDCVQCYFPGKGPEK